MKLTELMRRLSETFDTYGNIDVDLTDYDIDFVAPPEPSSLEEEGYCLRFPPAWVKVADQMPALTDGVSDHLLLWVVDDKSPVLGAGFVDTGHYSQMWRGWIADEGTLESQGYRVTHWAKYRGPEEES